MAVCVFTFSQDLWDFGVAGAEGAVDLEAIGVIQEWTAQGEQHFLGKQRSLLRFHFQTITVFEWKFNKYANVWTVFDPIRVNRFCLGKPPAVRDMYV